MDLHLHSEKVCPESCSSAVLASQRLVAVVATYLNYLNPTTPKNDNQSLTLHFVEDPSLRPRLSFQGSDLEEPIAISRALIHLFSGEASTLQGTQSATGDQPSVEQILCGSSKFHQSECDQWLSFVAQRGYRIVDADSLNTLNGTLADRTFLLSTDRLSLADLVVFSALSFWVESASKKEMQCHSQIARYYDHIEHLPGLQGRLPFLKPIAIQELLDATSALKATSAKLAGGATDKAAAPSTRVVASEKKQQKKEKQSKQPPPKEQQQKQQQQQQKQDERPIDDPMRLEMRVGKVVKAWFHPEAEKLFCEDVDIGESSGPRKIASGLRDHYELSNFEGQKVVVLANLKEKKLRGFPSHGMILCGIASNPDGTKGKVEILRPPHDAQGIPVVAPDPVLSSKAGKDTFSAVQPNFRIDNERGVAFYKDSELQCENTAGHLYVDTVRGGTIS